MPDGMTRYTYARQERPFVSVIDSHKVTALVLTTEKRRPRLAFIHSRPTLHANQQRSYMDNVEVLEERLETQELEMRVMSLHNQELREQNRNHLERIAQLEGQVNNLSSMLIPVSEKQVDDSCVATEFASLRSNIKRLARMTWTTTLKDGIDLEILTQSQEIFFTTFTPISYERLYTAVFYHIDDIILSSQSYFLDDRFKEFHHYFGQFEIVLRSESAAAADRLRAMEWRKACFKATEKYRGDGRSLSCTAQRRIREFLGPLQVKDTTTAQSAWKSLKDVCDKAIQVGLMIRQSPDDFRLDHLNRALNKPFSAWNQWAIALADVPAPANAQPGTIAYVISSALVKSPKEDMESVIVLEKAEVAVYE